LSVSTLWIALLHVRYSLIPDGTGIRQPSTARHCDPGLRAPLACWAGDSRACRASRAQMIQPNA